MKIYSRWPLLLLLLTQVACKKFVQINPPITSISSSQTYDNDLSAASAVTSIYEEMMRSNQNTSGGSLLSISCIGGLVADEFKNYQTSNAALSQAYTNSLSSTTGYVWGDIYKQIYIANAVLAGLDKSTGVSAAEKRQLIGEAKFMRAFQHFYGTNIFGGIPLVTTTNYQVNNVISRTPQPQVFRQIIADLKDAEGLLPDDFVTPTGGTVTTERVRPNKWAAASLLARAYLYTQAWDSAEAQATLVINNTNLFSLLTDMTGVFKMNSNEAIWQLQPVAPGYNTYDAYTFVLTGAPGSSRFPVALASTLINAFEPGDNRRVIWVDSITTGGKKYYFPYKYRANTTSSNTAPVSEYLMILRLAEQYLIRAEARAQQGNLQGAAADINVIRQRAGLLPTSATSQPDLLTAVYHERQVELFTELGHRWFDLKRTGNVNAVMGSPGNVCQNKGGTWSSNWSLFPIPASEIIINSNLAQNGGYY